MLSREEVVHRLAEVRANRQTTRFLLAVAACLFLAFCASIAVVRTSSFEAQVGQTFEILGEARALLSGLQDAETGQRGALLSERANFLEPYNAATSTIWPTYQKLRALVAEDPAQFARLDRMSALIAGKLKELAETLELDRTGRRNEALDRFRSGRGKVIMDQFRAEQAAFSQAEFERLQRQRQALSRSRLVMLAAIFLSLLFALFLGYLALQSNLSARKLRVRAEHALRQSEQRFRGVFRHAGTGIAITDAQGRFQTCNPAYSAMLGYSEEELRGLNFADLVHPEDRERNLIDNRRLLAQEIPSFQIVNRYLAKDGTAVWVHKHVSLTRDAAGTPTQILSLVADITDRKRAEEALRSQAALLDLAHDAIMVRDPEDKVTFWSRGAEETYGWTREEALGRVTHKLLRTRFPKPLTELLGEVTGKGHWDGELIHERKDGQEIVVASRWAAQRDGAGRPAGVLEINRDVTERKRAEETLRESEERFRALANASSEVLYQMSPDWTEMGRLSGGGFLADTESPDRNWLDRYIHWDDQPDVSAAIRKAIRTKSVFELEHRVRLADRTIGWVSSRAVPILNKQGEITSWFGAASDITARKRVEQHIQTLMREANHRSKNMLALVQVIARQTIGSNPKDFVTHFDERIQALAAAQDLLVKNEWKGVEVGELARSQLAHFKDLTGTRIELKGPPLFISASAAQTIGMALHELATNAGKYGALSNSKGRIAIEWSLDRAETGAETFAIAWRESGGPAVTVPERQGFGSAIIGELAEMSLGAKADLSFASSGLSWRLECEAGEIIDRRIPSVRDVTPVPGAQPPAQSNVLVVEDESLVALEIAHVLRDAGFNVLGPAGSVIKGLELVSRKGCDAAVLDVNLGKETSEPIALELKKRGTPFVTLSAYSREQSPAIFGGAPALAKPLRPELLVAEIRNCLQRHAAVGPHEF